MFIANKIKSQANLLHESEEASDQTIYRLFIITTKEARNGKTENGSLPWQDRPPVDQKESTQKHFECQWRAAR